MPIMALPPTGATKRAGKPDAQFEDKISWLRQLIEWQDELDSEQFLESLKTDVFIDQVFVYTPKGEIKALPRGATPLDFAYRIHTIGGTPLYWDQSKWQIGSVKS